MSTSPSSPAPSPFTVLLLHGSYHTPTPYTPFLSLLSRTHSIPTHCPQLPTSSPTLIPNSPPPHPDQSSDIATIHSLLHDLITNQSQTVLLVAHSSSGLTATAAAIPELQLHERRKLSLEGGILGIFYICALLVPVGESVHSFFQPNDGGEAVVPEWCRFDKNGMNGLATLNEAGKYFFNGLDEDKIKYYESTFTASPVLKTVLENDAYAQLPCRYLVTEDDRVLRKEYQENMVALQNMREGVHIEIVRCKAGHSPFLTWMEGLVEEVWRFGVELV